MPPQHLLRNNIILLACLLVLILVFPLVESRGLLFRDMLLSVIFLSGIFSLEYLPRARALLLSMATFTTVTTWAHHFYGTSPFHLIDFGSSFVTLAVIVALMIRQIARSRIVTPAIILSSVNGYLLLGVLGAVLLSIGNAVTMALNGPGSFGVALPDNQAPQFGDFLYFGFITLTTVGFGDITAVSPLTRSLVILISLAGPLYMTLLIAMLVGKFLSNPGAGTGSAEEKGSGAEDRPQPPRNENS